MKTSILKEPFLEKLNFASHFTSAKISSLVALQGIFIKAEKGLIHFYSTNLNSYYHTTMKTDNQSSFVIIIDPKRTGEFLALLEPGKINLEVKEKQIVISQGKTKGEFLVMSAEEFPTPPKTEEKPQEIEAEFFLKNLPLVLFAASTDETRPALSGVNFLTTDQDTSIVATDGFRLSLLRLKKIADFPPMILPSGFLDEVVRLVKGEKTIKFGYSPQEKTVNLRIGEHDLYTRLIEGDYPPFEKVIPTSRKTTVVLDKDEFLRNVKLVSIFAREFSNIIILKTTKDGIEMRPKTDQSRENVTVQEATVDGEEQKIAFNHRFIIDLLNNVEAKKITIELLRADSPAVFKSDKNPNFLHIIMPVRIQE